MGKQREHITAIHSGQIPLRRKTSSDNRSASISAKTSARVKTRHPNERPSKKFPYPTSTLPAFASVANNSQKSPFSSASPSVSAFSGSRPAISGAA